MDSFVITSKKTDRTSDSFRLYLKEISELDLLTPEEELYYTKRAALGDKEAIDELVKRNLRFVVSVAKKYVNSYNLLEDLVNEGNIGLILAAEKFKPEMGFKFISYAVWWVRKIIMEYLSNNGRLIRIPANKIDSLSKLDERIKQLEQKIGYSVDIIDVIDSLDDDTIEITDTKQTKKSKNLVFLDVLRCTATDSLSKVVGCDEDGPRLSDIISDDGFFKSVDQNMVDNDVRTELLRVLDTIKPRDKQIMISLLGLNSDFPKSMDVIADELGVSKEMVRKVREKNIEILAQRINKKIIR